MLKNLRNSVAGAVLLAFGAGGPALAQSSAELAIKVSQMEEQMRQLVGQVEQLTFEVRQLKSQIGKTDTGAAEPAPQQQPKKKLTLQQEPAAEQGIEDIGQQPIAQAAEPETYVKTIIAEDGSEQQVEVKKAAGPKILGTLDGSGAESAGGGDSGFQGQVLVAPTQQEAGDEPVVIEGSTDAIETVALAPESPESLYESSNESLLRRQFAEAEAGFRGFLQKYPDHSLAGSAQYWLGETFYAQSDFRQAAQAFLQGYRQYPKSRRAPDTLFKLGASLQRLGQTQQACAAFNAVSAEYPKAVEARKRAQAAAKSVGCAS